MPGRREMKPLWIGLSITVAAIVIGGALVWPFFKPSFAGSSTGSQPEFITAHDLPTHLYVMGQFDKILRSDVWYPRWLSDINDGYGSAWPNFYPPGFYYLTSLTNAVAHDWRITLLAISALSMAASGLGLYLLARTLCGRIASALAALAYMALPYHLLDLYWRGAMPEYLVFVLMPLILYFAHKLGREGGLARYSALGLCYGALLMVHVPAAYLFSFAMGLYALVWAAVEKQPRIALRIAGGAAIGVLLSAIYLAPAVVEGKYAYENITGMFPYKYSYVDFPMHPAGFEKLLWDSFTSQTALLVAAAVTWLCVCFARRRKPAALSDAKIKRGPQLQPAIWMIVAFAATFMNLRHSQGVSSWIPKIEFIAFAWRWLGVASVFAAALIAPAADAAIQRVKPGSAKTWLWLLPLVPLLVAVGFNARFGLGAVVGDALQKETSKPLTRLIESNYTPVNSTRAEVMPNFPQVMFKTGNGYSEAPRWEPQRRQVTVTAYEPSVIQFRTYNFPGWSARIDGQSAALFSEAEGLQLINVPAGQHRVEVFISSTGARTLGALLSGTGLLMVIGLAVFGYRRARVGLREKNSPPSPAQGAPNGATQVES